MKNLTFLTLTMLLVLQVCSCTAQEKKLLGKWKAVGFELDCDNVDAELEKITRELVLTYRMEFQKGGVFYYQDEFFPRSKGTWSLAGDLLNYEWKVEGNEQYGMPQPEPHAEEIEFVDDNTIVLNVFDENCRYMRTRFKRED